MQNSRPLQNPASPADEGKSSRRSRLHDSVGRVVSSLTSSSLSRDSFWLLCARLGTQVGMGLFTILLARQLGAAAFGAYAFMAAVVVIGNAATTWGTDMLLIREIAARDDWSLVVPALLLQLVLSALFVLGVVLASAALPGLDAQAAAALRIYSLSLFPLALFTVFTAILRGRQQMRAYAFLNLALIVLQLAAVLFLVESRGGLVLLARLLLMVQVVGALVAGLISANRLPVRATRWSWVTQDFVKLLKSSTPIAVIALLGIVYQRLSLLSLPALAGVAAAGQFSAAARLVEVAKLGQVAVLTALYPIMAQAMVAPMAEWWHRFRRHWLYLLIGALAAALGLSVLASPLIAFLYGNGYAQAAPVLRLMAWALVPYSVNSFLMAALLAAGETKAILRALGLGLVVLATLLLWWAPSRGALGAAWATVIAESVQAVALLLHELRRIRPARSIARSRGIV